MTLGQAFMWAGIICITPDVLWIFRAIYVFFILDKIRSRVISIYESDQRELNLNQSDAYKYLNSQRHAYWDFDKMMKHFWIWDINKRMK